MINNNGLYIVLEGIQGCGKSTQAKLLFEYLKNKYHDKNPILTREPGGTEIAEKIRVLVQGTKFEEEMDFICEAYLYAASRAQSLRKIVGPALQSGGVVISDRSFITSLSIQGNLRELGIELAYKINEEAIRGFLPNIVFLLKIDPKVAKERQQDHEGDKFENQDLEIYKKIDEGYKNILGIEQLKEIDFFEIDANRTENEIFNEISQIVDKYISERYFK